MKTDLRVSALAVLIVTACNRPDDALFSDVSLPTGNVADAGRAPTTGGATGSGAGSAVATGGATGTAGTEPASGGNAPVTGGRAGSDAGGSPNPPDGPGTAGTTSGAGGQPDLDPPAEPVCGNGILEEGEQCDDSGHTGQDGCDASCQVVCSHFGSGAAESDDHHCYNGYDSADFQGAQEACVKRGAHLVTISSAAENQTVRSLVNNSKWLGGYEDVSVSTKGTGAYGWLTGEPFTYTNWAQGEPDRAKVRCEISIGGPLQTTCYEHCISIQGDGTWVDARCDVADGYVCEWEPAGTK